MRDMRADLWNWANKAYAEASVREILLDFQDRFGLNVNVMLWCLWHGAYLGEIRESELRAAISLSSAWNDAVTVNIRKARRAAAAAMSECKPKTESREIGAMYDLLKSTELAAEKIELEKLAALTAERVEMTSISAATQGAARRSLAAYVRLTDAPTRSEFSTERLATLVETLASIGMIGSINQDSSNAAA